MVAWIRHNRCSGRTWKIDFVPCPAVRRFAQAPASVEDFHSRVPPRVTLDMVLRLEETRVLSNDEIASAMPAAEPLSAGEIVSSGTLAESHPISPGDAWTAVLTVSSCRI